MDMAVTPIIKITGMDLPNVTLYAKLEGYNPTGSVKDRAAFYILKKILKTAEINKDTLILESSSGNFGVALASYCKTLSLNFCCVIDVNISPANEKIIRGLSYKVYKITEVDENGGYLLNRIRKIKEILALNPNSYWVNQYANPYNAEAYYKTLGREIISQTKDVDYIFIGVSSGGTITGVSRKIKELSPTTKIIAVDTEGSVIFGGKPKKRFIPGIGSSLVPEILESAKIDEVITISEKLAVEMCHNFSQKHSMLIGGSSGSVLAAVHQYFKRKKIDYNINVLTIFADRGERYLDSIYNEKWCKERFNI